MAYEYGIFSLSFALAAALCLYLYFKAQKNTLSVTYRIMDALAHAFILAALFGLYLAFGELGGYDQIATAFLAIFQGFMWIFVLYVALKCLSVLVFVFKTLLSIGKVKEENIGEYRR